MTNLGIFRELNDIPSLRIINGLTSDIFGNIDYFNFYQQLKSTQIMYVVQTRNGMIKKLGEEAYRELWTSRNKNIASIQELDDEDITTKLEEGPIVENLEDNRIILALKKLYNYLDEDEKILKV